jgi:hypothetical protein
MSAASAPAATAAPTAPTKTRRVVSFVIATSGYPLDHTTRPFNAKTENPISSHKILSDSFHQLNVPALDGRAMP